MTDKQLKANRQNGKLGGVKSDTGKAVSKYNALTHGVLKQALTEYEQGVYAELLPELEAEFKPESFIEKILVERMAIWYIRLFRAGKAEKEFMNFTLHPAGMERIEDQIKKYLSEDPAEYDPVRVSSRDMATLADTLLRYDVTA